MYLFDEQINPVMLRTLQGYGPPFSLMHSIYDVFGKSIKDPALIPQIAAGGYILVTCDRKMRNRRGKDGHYYILKEYDQRVLFLPRGFSTSKMRLSEQMAFLSKYWPSIHQQVCDSTARLANIHPNGTVVTHMEIYT